MRALLLALCVCVVRCQLGDWGDYQLIWEDTFDTIDLSKWQYEYTATGGGNNEFEVYADDPMNAHVVNGELHILPLPLAECTNPSTGAPYGEEFLNSGVLDMNALYGQCTNGDQSGCYRTGANSDIPPIMSSRLRSLERFSFTYGRVRVRAQMPTGDWTWPAVWLLPELWVYGGWPASGEIDIIEIRGNEDLKYADGVTWAGIQQMGSTLHWGPDYTQNRYYLTHAETLNETNPYSRDHHMLEMDWSTDGFRFVVDDVEFLNVPDPLIPSNPGWTGFWDFGGFPPEYTNPGWNTLMAPFDQAFHFILNVAVGGTGYFPDDLINRGGDPQYTKPWSNSMNQIDAMNSFYSRKDDWYWTWTKEGMDSALHVDFIEVYEKIVP